MNDKTKVAWIVGGAIIVAIGLYVYFSPYQTCVRSLAGRNVNAGYACATALGQDPN